VGAENRRIGGGGLPLDGLLMIRLAQLTRSSVLARFYPENIYFKIRAIPATTLS
jgi:hypothetical protein